MPNSKPNRTIAAAIENFNAASPESIVRIAWGLPPTLDDPEINAALRLKGALLQYRDFDFELQLTKEFWSLSLQLKPRLPIRGMEELLIIALMGNDCQAITHVDWKLRQLQVLRFPALPIKGLQWHTIPMAADRLLEARAWLIKRWGEIENS